MTIFLSIYCDSEKMGNSVATNDSNKFNSESIFVQYARDKGISATHLKMEDDLIAQSISFTKNIFAVCVIQFHNHNCSK